VTNWSCFIGGLYAGLPRANENLILGVKIPSPTNAIFNPKEVNQEITKKIKWIFYIKKISKVNLEQKLLQANDEIENLTKHN
jgi:hypothetical protein